MTFYIFGMRSLLIMFFVLETILFENQLSRCSKKNLIEKLKRLKNLDKGRVVKKLWNLET